MKHKTKILTNLAALATLASLTSTAQSANINEDGFYLGANYGYLRVEGDDDFDEDKDVISFLP